MRRWTAPRSTADFLVSPEMSRGDTRKHGTARPGWLHRGKANTAGLRRGLPKGNRQTKNCANGLGVTVGAVEEPLRRSCFAECTATVTGSWAATHGL